MIVLRLVSTFAYNGRLSSSHVGSHQRRLPGGSRRRVFGISDGMQRRRRGGRPCSTSCRRRSAAVSIGACWGECGGRRVAQCSRYAPPWTDHLKRRGPWASMMRCVIAVWFLCVVVIVLWGAVSVDSKGEALGRGDDIPDQEWGPASSMYRQH